MPELSAWQSAQAFFRLIRQEPRRPLLMLGLCMAIVSVSEGFGVSLLVPLFALLQDAAHTGIPRPSAFNGMLARSFSALSMPFQGLSILLVFISLQALKTVAQFFREILSTEIQCNLVDRLRERCLMAVLKSEWTWLSQRNNAEYANLLLTDINRIGFGLNFFIQLSSVMAQLLVYTIAALWLSPPMTALVLSAGILMFFTESRLRREALHLGAGLGLTSQRLHSTVQESLQGIKLVKILGNESRHLQNFLQSMQGYRQQLMRFQRSASYSRARAQLLASLMLAVLLYTGLEVWHLPLAELAALILVFSRLMPLAAQCQQHLQQCLHTLPALADTERVLAQCREAAEPETAAVAPTFSHQLTLHGIDFHYPGRERAALKAIDLTIVANTTTAIIGESGAGKSSLADMLMGLLRPEHGTMSIDGKVLDDAQRVQWRHALAYVPQEPVLFNDTIRSNLLWALPDADDTALWLALDKAAAGFVRDLPLGLATLVGDQGLRLSGGERQRIALARALLRRPALLLLDEATSALDVENEERIRQAIVDLHGNLTVVAIGHRLASLQHADHVVVMEAGRIVRQGTWQQVQAADAAKHLTRADS
ncbi:MULTISPECIES: ABC transporter ATP-binding protein [unclassified Undibacterium]|nr:MULTISPECIES: ABC transporter ATP-binding protein [unclassified Undibacterium]MEB0140915.1 ABC transporter ATP-binding protein [Undibacterium sp. CCC2.1]MEB0173891.1 ABC transporter ATP-binding protein [Undibacterium sp. CCC1.1]MEB0177886.1 ABC transporter ATP-binding protein [Undibacterium sp. CCC3.4]MEB0217090.1 ABC transporter ATP-binding protein [Undibacterium sp. 5I2]WPX42125.1 ABC transporter ATP-binding protein [Undibacterium sp. CCC3.4]